MRFGPKDKFWVVTDPTPHSGLADILFETSLAGLMNQFKGGLRIEDNPTIFTEPVEAQVDAMDRLHRKRALDRAPMLWPRVEGESPTKSMEGSIEPELEIKVEVELELEKSPTVAYGDVQTYAWRFLDALYSNDNVTEDFFEHYPEVSRVVLYRNGQMNLDCRRPEGVLERAWERWHRRRCEKPEEGKRDGVV